MRVSLAACGLELDAARARQIVLAAHEGFTREVLRLHPHEMTHLQLEHIERLIVENPDQREALRLLREILETVSQPSAVFYIGAGPGGGAGVPDARGGYGAVRRTALGDPGGRA